MGKDREGRFHPGKGKPSGLNKEEGLGLQHTDPEKMDQYNELTEKYTEGEDQLSQAAPVRNNNRNTNKGRSGKGKKRTDTVKAGTGPSAEGGHTSKSPAGGQAGAPSEETMEPDMLPGLLTKERFSELANYKASCCVSIYTNRPASLAENISHFKNQLSELETMLHDRGMAQGTATQFLRPAVELLKNEGFWVRHQSSQLAFFIAEDVFKCMVLDHVGITARVIDRSFYVTPLLPFLKDDNYFFINVISKNGCTLFRADKRGIQPVPVILPADMEEVKDFPEKNASVFRTMEGGNQVGNFHGAGEGGPDDKTMAAIFFEAIDDIVWKQVLRNENVPMVLAGVEYVLPIYRSVSDYTFIWDEYLTGNREQQDSAALYVDAMKIMKPYFDGKMNRALEDYGNLSGTDKTSSVVADIIPAAYYARISHLFVLKGEFIWGLFNEESNTLELNHSPDEGGEDLVDNAVVKTISNGGVVFLLDKEQMPVDSQMAAIFRY
jgi:hypothetical protein